MTKYPIVEALRIDGLYYVRGFNSQRDVEDDLYTVIARGVDYDKLPAIARLCATTGELTAVGQLGVSHTVKGGDL